MNQGFADLSKALARTTGKVCSVTFHDGNVLFSIEDLDHSVDRDDLRVICREHGYQILNYTYKLPDYAYNATPPTTVQCYNLGLLCRAMGTE